MQRQTKSNFKYDQTLADEYSLYSEFNQIYEFFIDTFLRVHGTPSGTLIDLCCGTGDVINKFKQQFPQLDVTGCDRSIEMINASKYDGTLIHGDISTITTVFDNVVSNNAYHHFDNIQDFWNTVYQITHSKSKILISDVIRPENEEDVLQIVNNVLGPNSMFETAFTLALTSAYTEDELKTHIGLLNLIIVDTPINNYKLFFIHN